MEELVEVIAKSLVAEPDKVFVRRCDNDDSIIIHLITAPEDMGKVIGKGGRIAKAIRTLVSASSSASGKRVQVNIDG